MSGPSRHSGRGMADIGSLWAVAFGRVVLARVSFAVVRRSHPQTLDVRRGRRLSVNAQPGPRLYDAGTAETRNMPHPSLRPPKGAAVSASDFSNAVIAECIGAIEVETSTCQENPGAP